MSQQESSNEAINYIVADYARIRPKCLTTNSEFHLKLR